VEGEEGEEDVDFEVTEEGEDGLVAATKGAEKAWLKL
jgi:hypothetical protein